MDPELDSDSLVQLITKTNHNKKVLKISGTKFVFLVNLEACGTVDLSAFSKTNLFEYYTNIHS